MGADDFAGEEFVGVVEQCERIVEDLHLADKTVIYQGCIEDCVFVQRCGWCSEKIMLD